MPIAGVLLVLTGLAIWKPVQLAPLTNLFGGYVWARYWHFVATVALVVALASSTSSWCSPSIRIRCDR